MALFYNVLLTDKVYMKNNQFKPKVNNLSLVEEKINTVIERDIALVLLIMAGGLLHSDNLGMRGFPVPWLYPSHSAHVHSSAGGFIASLITAIAIVAVCEILNAVLRRALEPTAFRNNAPQSSVYANTYDDSQEFKDIPDNGAFDIKDASTYSKALQKHQKGQKLYRKAEAALPNSIPARNKPVNTAANKASGKLALRMVMVTFAATIIFIGAIFTTIISNNGFEDDIATDDTVTENGEEYGSLIDTPFFEDDEYLQGECDRIIDMLRAGDEEGLADIGDGDVQALLGLTDWGSAEFERDYRYAVSGEPDAGFIRFRVSSDSGSCMLGIKFEGDGLATDEEKAAVTGISGCTSKPWDDYDYDDEEGWDKFNAAVEDNRIVIGDDDFMGYSILTW